MVSSNAMQVSMMDGELFDKLEYIAQHVSEVLVWCLELAPNAFFAFFHFFTNRNRKNVQCLR